MNDKLNDKQITLFYPDQIKEMKFKVHKEDKIIKDIRN